VGEALCQLPWQVCYPATCENSISSAASQPTNLIETSRKLCMMSRVSPLVSQQGRRAATAAGRRQRVVILALRTLVRHRSLLLEQTSMIRQHLRFLSYPSTCVSCDQRLHLYGCVYSSIAPHCPLLVVLPLLLTCTDAYSMLVLTYAYLYAHMCMLLVTQVCAVYVSLA
jgi:hypothetical protein